MAAIRDQGLTTDQSLSAPSWQNPFTNVTWVQMLGIDRLTGLGKIGAGAGLGLGTGAFGIAGRRGIERFTPPLARPA